MTISWPPGQRISCGVRLAEKSTPRGENSKKYRLTLAGKAASPKLSRGTDRSAAKGEERNGLAPHSHPSGTMVARTNSDNRAIGPRQRERDKSRRLGQRRSELRNHPCNLTGLFEDHMMMRIWNHHQPRVRIRCCRGLRRLLRHDAALPRAHQQRRQAQLADGNHHVQTVAAKKTLAIELEGVAARLGRHQALLRDREDAILVNLALIRHQAEARLRGNEIRVHDRRQSFEAMKKAIT